MILKEEERDFVEVVFHLLVEVIAMLWRNDKRPRR
jgi:hypothetical protein